MNTQSISSQLQELKEILQEQKKQDEVFYGIDETVNYLGFKKSYLYKLVHLKQIPFHKPNGKKLFFAKSDLDKWILSNSKEQNNNVKLSA